MAEHREDSILPLTQDRIDFKLVACKKKIIVASSFNNPEISEITAALKDSETYVFQLPYRHQLIAAGEIFEENWTRKNPHGPRGHFYIVYNDATERAQIMLFSIATNKHLIDGKSINPFSGLQDSPMALASHPIELEKKFNRDRMRIKGFNSFAIVTGGPPYGVIETTVQFSETPDRQEVKTDQENRYRPLSREELAMLIHPFNQ